MTEPETLPLAAGFPTATGEEWRKLVDAVLKGAPFERLASSTYDGLTIKPLAQRRSDARPVAGRPGAAGWQVMARIEHPDPALANEIALRELNNGAGGLSLVFSGATGDYGFGLPASEQALGRTLEGFDFGAGAALDLDMSPRAAAIVDAALAKGVLLSGHLSGDGAGMRIGHDPIGAMAVAGTAARPWSEEAPHFAGRIAALMHAGFLGKLAVADGRIVHNAGGSEAQELAFVLGVALAYLRALEAGGVALDAARRVIFFRLSADTDQFLTIAKFRALRKLWARVEASCALAPGASICCGRNGVAHDDAARSACEYFARHRRHVRRDARRRRRDHGAAVHRRARPARAFRATHRAQYPTGSARRVAPRQGRRPGGRLRRHRGFDRSVLPRRLGAVPRDRSSRRHCCCTNQRTGPAKSRSGARQARGRGGATAGSPDRGQHISPSFRKRREGRFAGAAAPKRAADGLQAIRLAEPFEALRDTSDRLLAATGARPKIFLATLGTQAEFTARATFAQNLFEAGGIEILGGDGADLPALAEAFKATATSLACLCSSDKVYAERAAAAAQTLKAAGARHIYLAGRPGELEAALKAAGVQSFVYEGCDAVATLKSAYDMLGVEIG